MPLRIEFIAKLTIATLAAVMLMSALACQDEASPTISPTPDTQATIDAGVNATIAAATVDASVTATIAVMPTSVPTPVPRRRLQQHLHLY